MRWESWEGRQFQGENQMFSFWYVMFVIVIRHLCGDIKQVTKYSILEFKVKMRPGVIICEVRITHLVDEHLGS